LTLILSFAYAAPQEDHEQTESTESAQGVDVVAEARRYLDAHPEPIRPDDHARHFLALVRAAARLVLKKAETSMSKDAFTLEIQRLIESEEYEGPSARNRRGFFTAVLGPIFGNFGAEDPSKPPKPDLEAVQLVDKRNLAVLFPADDFLADMFINQFIQNLLSADRSFRSGELGPLWLRYKEIGYDLLAEWDKISRAPFKWDDETSVATILQWYGTVIQLLDRWIGETDPLDGPSRGLLVTETQNAKSLSRTLSALMDESERDINVSLLARDVFRTLILTYFSSREKSVAVQEDLDPSLRFSGRVDHLAYVFVSLLQLFQTIMREHEALDAKVTTRFESSNALPVRIRLEIQNASPSLEILEGAWNFQNRSVSTGVGYPLAVKLVHALSGTIELIYRDGTVSGFHVRLPSQTPRLPEPSERMVKVLGENQAGRIEFAYGLLLPTVVSAGWMIAAAPAWATAITAAVVALIYQLKRTPAAASSTRFFARAA
jgi:hypothetical protein